MKIGEVKMYETLLVGLCDSVAPLVLILRTSTVRTRKLWNRKPTFRLKISH